MRFGYSPCPNDTFAFYAAKEGKVGEPFEVEHHDVETLNRRAFEGRYEVTKLSFGALGRLLDDYALLRSGGALGRGVGPIVVAREGIEPAELASDDTDVVIPGELTTAHLLLQLHSRSFEAADERIFDEIMPAVADGGYDAGLVIHEGRFTYQDHGLTQVLDLGEWWEKETGAPVPLGCIAVRRDVEDPGRIEEALSASVGYARDRRGDKGLPDDDDLRGYVREHADEIDDDVLRRHIDLYVNGYTVDMGDEGVRAVETLFTRAREAGILPDTDADDLLAVRSRS
ncbi:1,4-dihydroxy-6-naphthoate synthase [Haladaptatus sp. F3-133]|jgi:1,4-dihydroxy-6-naphthoate synthase|uniref:1,4-dihydroxy-6-naphtoate synthase n=1 Tax=Halorutilus salinus TaxID=2487751 RepID=A0A9Q4C6N3_9EURY|nr:1,4-dihydroxy-6-naphthoate synthase [Halorutilus salinus]MCX2819256.1 1,4-dihydroxy-6-naphthoate synthase [Halorutilus salinus]